MSLSLGTKLGRRRTPTILQQIANVVLPVFLIAALGYIFGKKKKIDLSSINEFVVYLATPALILSSLSHDPIELGLAGKVFISVCVVVGLCSLLGFLAVRVLRIPLKVYVPPVMFANTGNMGLPLVFFAFGEAGFRVAILYMVSTTILHYTVGILILNYDKSPFELFKLPLVYSAIAGVLLSVSDVTMPTALDRAIHLLGEASIPSMIFALGYKLSEVALKHVSRSFIFGALRVFGGVMFGVLAVWLFKLDGIAAKVVILQSAMPPAVFNFVLAEKYKQDSQAVASIILAGTIISIFTIPVIVALLLR